jgi:hypothetical protein
MFNKKKLSVIFLSALSFVFLIQAIAATALILIPATAQADTQAIKMQLQVPLPTLHGGNANITFTTDTSPIADYIKAIYNYAVGAVGIVAAVVLMIGGVMWITAGGNTSSVSEAKSMITAALTGLVLVMTSYLILGQVNPALINLQADVIQSVPPSATPAAPNAPTCVWAPISDLSGQNVQDGMISYDIDQFHASIVSDQTNCNASNMPKLNPAENLFTSYYCSCSYPKDQNKKCTWLKDCDPNKYTVISFNTDAVSTDNYSAVSSCGSYLGEADYDCCCLPAAK